MTLDPAAGFTWNLPHIPRLKEKRYLTSGDVIAMVTPDGIEMPGTHCMVNGEVKGGIVDLITSNGALLVDVSWVYDHYEYVANTTIASNG